MKLRRKTVVGSSICIVAGMIAIAVYEVGERLRSVQNDSFVAAFATGVNSYQSEFLRYPESLEQMSRNDRLSSKWRDLMRQTIANSRGNPWGDVYMYSVSSNGYSISVIGPATPPLGWVGLKRRIEKVFLADNQGK